MSINEPPAECWILISDIESDETEPGKIMAGHCDCTAGAGETCSHVGAVLYALSYLREICLGKRVYVAELPSYWYQPSGSVQDNLYVPIEDIDFGRKTETSCDLQFYDLEKLEEDYKKLIRDLMESGGDVAVSGAFFENDDAINQNIASETVVESLLFQRFYNESNIQKSRQELANVAGQIDWKLSQDDCYLIENMTLAQSSNPLWFKHWRN